MVLELCNPNLLNAENMNDVKLLECHNQEIIGWDGETLYLLGNGMLVRIVWTCWVDQLHLLKIIPLSGKISGTPREGRYFIPDGLVTIDNYGAEVQDGVNEHYMTPADFSDFPCCEDGFGFLHMEDACGIPKIPCELFHDSYDMYRMAEELRK